MAMAMSALAKGKIGNQLKIQRTISEARRRLSLSAAAPSVRSMKTPVGAMAPARIFRMMRRANPEKKCKKT